MAEIRGEVFFGTVLLVLMRISWIAFIYEVFWTEKRICSKQEFHTWLRLGVKLSVVVFCWYCDVVGVTAVICKACKTNINL